MTEMKRDGYISDYNHCLIVSVVFYPSSSTNKMEWYMYKKKHSSPFYASKALLVKNSMKTFSLFKSPMKHQTSYKENPQYLFPLKSSISVLVSFPF